ncbi:hypothetical protein NDU88_006159 [Pleurodeles waltl]|uniref:Uncharacterized protein n=1 Tax=Pleurodeles waltl TaxID=8319 RepID=A0AAV7LZE5_PLEWA|nr:hypothetical protein NDU88_006159 [Pleurodeles waltl]
MDTQTYGTRRRKRRRSHASTLLRPWPVARPYNPVHRPPLLRPPVPDTAAQQTDAQLSRTKDEAGEWAANSHKHM